MQTILKVLRKPWILHPGYWIPSLLMPQFIGFFSIDFSRVAPYGAIDVLLLARVLAVTIFLALFIQTPLLLISCVYISRIKARLSSSRFWIVFVILVLIPLVIDIPKGERDRLLSIEFFFASLLFLALCGFSCWLFDPVNIKNTTSPTNSAPDLSNAFSALKATYKTKWIILISFVAVIAVLVFVKLLTSVETDEQRIVASNTFANGNTLTLYYAKEDADGLRGCDPAILETRSIVYNGCWVFAWGRADDGGDTVITVNYRYGNTKTSDNYSPSIFNVSTKYRDEWIKYTR
ncbi:hypothetical protein ACFQPC_16305 [Herminiimonas glaciei]|uniref:DUF805 domain-containing protein n=1 Tax=Herminiimonas glaciei TaxID=523788 RepID=A0ABW2IES0_9BURK